MSNMVKISRPRLSATLPREGLFAELDKTGKLPLTFITGPAGCGKTTLVASYLEARQLPSVWYKVDCGDDQLSSFFHHLSQALGNFAEEAGRIVAELADRSSRGIQKSSRQFFHNLADCIKPPFVLVLDDYQEISPDAPLHRALLAGLSRIPEGLAVIIMSRNGPPASFSRLRANRQMAILGWEQLRLTESECRKICLLQGLSATDMEHFPEVFAQIDGWAAGLQLLMNGCLAKKDAVFRVYLASLEDIFEYFAGEVYDELADDIKDFLLKTSFLNSIHADQAARLTGFPHVDSLLSFLCRSNRFTKRMGNDQSLYQFHPLFRRFLQDRANMQFTAQQKKVLLQKVASLMLEAGQEEQGSQLLRQASDWEGLAWLILQKAHALIEQGRSQVLGKWLQALPGHMVEADPRLLYWLGMAKRESDCLAARQFFHRAFTIFRDADGGRTDTMLAWAGIMECLLASLDDRAALDLYLAVLEEILPDPYRLPAGEAAERVTVCMYVALVIRQPRHENFSVWEERGLLLAQSTSDLTVKTRILAHAAIYRTYTGRCDEAEEVLDILRQSACAMPADHASRIRIIAAEIFLANARGQFNQAAKLVNDGLALADLSGMHGMDAQLLCDGVRAALYKGDAKFAAGLLARMAAMPQIKYPACQFCYHYLHAALALQEGSLANAASSAALARELADTAVICYAKTACILLRAAIAWTHGSRQAAWQLLQQGKETASRDGYLQLELEGSLLEASFHLVEGNTQAGLDALRQAMVLGSGQHGLVPFLLERAVLAELCAKAIVENIQSDYAQKIVQRCRLQIPQSPQEVEEWPWMFRVYTLGRFGLVKFGRKLPYASRKKTKPLALFKVLLAFGGRNVGEMNIMDALWNESDGEKARRSLDTTLFRLRSLLGAHEAILLQKGKVTIDPNCCWVDAWAFERLLNRAEALLKKNGGNTAQATALAHKAFALYHGSFLPQDNDEHWTIPMRERLQSRFERGIELFGRQLETAGKWQEAAGLYQQAMEKSPLSEVFYQRLMICLQKQNRTTEALKVYSNCCQVLRAVLDTEPSSATTRLHRSLRAGIDQSPPAPPSPGAAG
ncbi:MAG: BTAD domain-containing putative transcriptional regulator [Thermodesulfobacteriota bacterium]